MVQMLCTSLQPVGHTTYRVIQTNKTTKMRAVCALLCFVLVSYTSAYKVPGANTIVRCRLPLIQDALTIPYIGTSSGTRCLLATEKKSFDIQPAQTKRANGLGWALKRVVQLPVKCAQTVTNFFRTQLPMLRYLWPEDNMRLRVYLVLSMMFMFLGKWFNTKVPFILQRAIDAIPTMVEANKVGSYTGVSVALAILFYGLSRAAAVVCEETKTCLFTNVSQNVLRKFAYQIFSHLHTLGSDFHLQTPSGTISVAYVRAVRGFQALMFQLVFSVAPTLLELTMVANILYRKFSPTFALITVGTFTSYMLFTIFVTQWRVNLRREIVEVDNTRNGFFIDSLLNQEVVKLFNNQKQEISRFDGYLARMQKLNIESTYSIAVLNIGQAVLFCAGLTTSLLVALGRVQAGSMSVGDLVAVNSMLLQLAIPFDFIGYTYQELRQSLVDMAYMSEVLNANTATVHDSVTAVPIEQAEESQHPYSTGHSTGARTTIGVAHEVHIPAAVPTALTVVEGRMSAINSAAVKRPASTLEFRDVSFSYKRNGLSDIVQRDTSVAGVNQDTAVEPRRESESSEVLLNGISFKINAGENVAIVGPSGSGKSTTLKLITRMLNIDAGSILLDGIDISTVSAESLRRRVAVVPQDTCLFDETVGYNIKYGHQQATDEEVQEVVKQSNLVDTIAKLPKGLDTTVGERGARLSGGERQKVSIARALLRRPSLLLCDEVTSSVDALAEREIIDALSGRCSSGRSHSVDAGYSGSRRGGAGELYQEDRLSEGTFGNAVAQIPVCSLHSQLNNDGSSLPERTTITVAHRLSSIIHCDRILVLQKGRVVEQGTHAELLCIPHGVYRHMWNVQNNIAEEEGGDGVAIDYDDIVGNYGNISNTHRLNSMI